MDNKKEIIERYSGRKKTYPLRFFTEYYQFYIRDKNSRSSTDSDIFWTAQASEDKMAVEEGLLGISVAKYATIDVTVNIHVNQPTDSFSAYDHIVEASIDAPSGVLQVLDCTGMQVQLEINMTPGTYTVRSSSVNLKTVQGDEGNDFYVIDIYPSEKKERTVWKRYRPDLPGNTIKKYACPCCGYKTMYREDHLWDICPVCFWQSDPFQNTDPDYKGGANRISLKEAQQNFIAYHACEESAKPFVRLPNDDEARDSDWKMIE